MKRRTLLQLPAALALSGCAQLPDRSVSNDSDIDQFSFVVLGCTAYEPYNYAIYQNLIDRINTKRPRFSIHVGDTKGHGRCDLAHHKSALSYFNRFDHPLIYTPGDNEWVDCARDPNFPSDPYESLNLIRDVFFSEPMSLGSSPIPLVRQSDVSEHDEMKENVRWDVDGVMFITLHITGSNNGFGFPEPDEVTDPRSVKRDLANAAWLRDAITRAQSGKLKALVIAYHGEIFEPLVRENLGFKRIHEVFLELTQKLTLPVLLVHADWHQHKIDRPFFTYPTEGDRFGTGYNVTRMQTYGAPEMRAVMVHVNFEDPEFPFSFETISVPQALDE